MSVCVCVIGVGPDIFREEGGTSETLVTYLLLPVKGLIFSTLVSKIFTLLNDIFLLVEYSEWVSK